MCDFLKLTYYEISSLKKLVEENKIDCKKNLATAIKEAMNKMKGVAMFKQKQPTKFLEISKTLTLSPKKLREQEKSEISSQSPSKFQSNSNSPLPRKPIITL